MKTIKHILILTRLDSNIKNIILIFFAFFMSSTEFNFLNVFLGILSLSILSSATYTYNSYTDYFIDINNKNKKHYHDAINNIGRKNTLVLFFSLLFLGLILAYTINYYFFIVVIIYILVNFLYTNPITRFKEKRFLDIIFGGGLTNVLRFTAGWYIFNTSFPPIFILFILSFSKIGGFLFYKNMDRKFLKNQQVKNTITYFSAQQINFFAIFFLLITIILIILSCLNGIYFNYPILGKLPPALLFLLIPLPFIIYFATRLQKKNKYNFKKIRTYSILISFIIFLIIVFFYIQK